MDDNFPNGIKYYLQTHCIISMELQRLIGDKIGFPWKVYNESGTGAVHELAENLTKEFEKTHIDENWITKDYLEEI
jgi:hypothetical protein